MRSRIGAIGVGAHFVLAGLLGLSVARAGGGPAPVSRAPGPAVWSRDGHEIVCEIAFQRLTRAGRRLVFAARADDPDPSPTFRQSCVWADSSRYGDHRSTYEYHFVNVDKGSDSIDLQRDCGAYDCV